MKYRIDDIEGVGPTYREGLMEVGIGNTWALLERCGDRKGRASIAQVTQIPEKRILEWVNMADLMRVRGVGPQIAELMKAAGVDTVKELRTRNPDNLAKRMAQVNAELRLTKAQVGAGQIAGFIESAARLEPCVSH